MREAEVRDAGTAYWAGLGHARCRKVNQVCFKQREMDLPTGSRSHSVLPQNNR